VASTLKFDSERRAMRRERREARVARKREGQEARELKHACQLEVVRASRVTVERPAPAPVVEVLPAIPVNVSEPEVAPEAVRA
jgi:hypothetical protein